VCVSRLNREHAVYVFLLFLFFQCVRDSIYVIYVLVLVELALMFVINGLMCVCCGNFLWVIIFNIPFVGFFFLTASNKLATPNN
jgi:hypothetical protein